MTDLVTIQDVETQLGETLQGREADQVIWFIRRASAEMRRLVPLLDDRLDSGDLESVAVVGVGVDVVIDALESMRRGVGVRSVQYPEFSTEYYRAASDELISLSAEQIARLSPVVPVGAAQVFNLSLSGGD